LGGVLVAILPLIFGAFIFYATSHPKSRASRALFWWQIRHGDGPENSRVTQFFGYLTGFFWIAIALIALLSALR
jgi:hypothetical protein